MSAMFPEIDDAEFDLIMEAANNWYDCCISLGFSGLNPPNISDTKYRLLSKTAYFTARLAEVV